MNEVDYNEYGEIEHPASAFRTGPSRLKIRLALILALVGGLFGFASSGLPAGIIGAAAGYFLVISFKTILKLLVAIGIIIVIRLILEGM